jgi:hypothetical protein
MEPDLVRVATRLVGVLGAEDCLLVGGMAVAAHGYVRATEDVDLVVRCPLAEARRRLGAHGIQATLFRGDPRGGDFPCLKGVVEGSRFDILPPLVPLEWEQALVVTTEGGPLRIVSLEGLLRLKLRAQGVQDVLDVAVLVLRHPEHRALAREIAQAHRVQQRLDQFLADRRTQAPAEAQRRNEEGPRRRPRRRRR